MFNVTEHPILSLTRAIGRHGEASTSTIKHSPLTWVLENLERAHGKLPPELFNT